MSPGFLSLPGEPFPEEAERRSRRFSVTRNVDGLLEALGSHDIAPGPQGRPADLAVPIREQATVALGELGDVRALDGLVQALGDRAERVRLAAAVSLGMLGSPDAAEWLSKAVAGWSRPEHPSLPTSRETPMTPQLLGPAGENGAHDVVDGEERSRRARSAASRRRAQRPPGAPRRAGG